MRLITLATALAAGLLLAGCTQYHSAQAPIATTYPYSEQQRMQAAHHWGILARHEANGILRSERLRLKSLHLPDAEPHASGEFARGFRTLLTSELVTRGAHVTTQPGFSAEVHVDVEVISHRDRSFIRPPVGAFTSLAAGIGVANLGLNHWSRPAVGLIPAAAITADVASGNWTYTGNEEVIITTQVIDGGTILYSSSNLYYINAGDRRHYAPHRIPAQSPFLPSPSPTAGNAMKRLPSLLVILLLSSLVLLGGCSSNGPVEPPEPELDELIDEAAQRMLDANPDLTRYSPMIAATFVSIDNLSQSSTLGRIGSELFASALSRAGMQVREVKMRDSLYIEEDIGELILSREVQRLSQAHNARSILMGTYAQGQNTLYLSVRVVRSSDAMVLGSTNLAVPLNNNLRAMLGGGW